ncbi:phospholipase A2 [Nonomuraea sp. MG754425]|uniref:phospholipase A2 n=1 Tax=Nonomuraea sp. MG754425 TaxID=2570319 RepID=UPI001EED40B6|nr:phospholipase A2 [Nonomuraea sp. MG754425]
MEQAKTQAKTENKRIEIEALRSETATYYANADGKSLQAELHANPIRIKKSATWQAIDTKLVESSGTLQPKVAKIPLLFSAGGDALPLAQVSTESGETLALKWPAPLPRPTIAGNTATYKDGAAPGTDIVLTALAHGFRYELVVRQQPGKILDLKLPVTLRGLTATGHENRVFTGTAGKTTLLASGPRVSAHVDPKSPRTGKAMAKAENSGSELRLTADLTTMDEASFPVTLSSSYTIPSNADVDVADDGSWADPSFPFLTAGSLFGIKNRAHLVFDTASLAWQKIIDARLSVLNTDGPGCGDDVGAGIQARRITSQWDAADLTWATAPSSTSDGSVIVTKSYASDCGPGTLEWPVSDIVTAWSTGEPNYGVVLQSADEGSEDDNYRVLASAEYGSDQDAPTLTVTYESVPSLDGTGRTDPETGSFIVDGIDLHESAMVTTRNHSAGSRGDTANPNEQVLGPDWRLTPLGGMLSARLSSRDGSLLVTHASGSSKVFDPVAGRADTWRAADGETILQNANGTFTQQGGEPDIVITWRMNGDEGVIIDLGGADLGTQHVDYDAQGRVSTITSPDDPETVCASASTSGCHSATFSYATQTTATGTTLGDQAGQLKEITYASTGVPAVALIRYSYDADKRLREVYDLRDYETGTAKVAATPLKSSYTYDATGNITQLTTPEDGTWNLTYSAPGQLVTAEPAPGVKATTPCYASDFMLGKRAGCWVNPVYMDNEPEEPLSTRKSPKWLRTVHGMAVVGVEWDHCTNPVFPGDYKDYPGGFDFRRACDSHDYGYGIIYSHKYSNFLKPRKTAVDAVFFHILANGVCDSYPLEVGVCEHWAYIYYKAVYYQGGTAMNPEG